MELIREVADGVLTLTFNRPAKLNAITNDLAQALLDALDEAAADASVRALRIRGNGRAYCAGRDVSAAPTERDLVLVQAVASTLVRIEKPVVFAVHGWTIGAGLEWMLDGDIAIAARDARFKLPEAALGVFATGGLSATLTAHAGLGRAKALILLGEAFDAEQALAWGLVSQVVAPEELDATSLQVARRLAALQPEVVGQFKRVLNQVGLARFDDAIRLENQAHRALGHASRS